MKISIIIPVYNVEKYIEKCLKSVQNQSYKDIEVIVVNDGTKDNSQEIVDRFCKEDSRFHSYIKENGGLSDARNYGTNKATGEYIVYLDSDDFWDLNLLERLVNDVETSNTKPDLVYFPKRLIDEQGKELSIEKLENMKEVSGQDVLSVLRKKHLAFETAWSYLIKKTYWDENKFKFAKGRLHEDIGIMPIVLVKSNNVNVINEPYYNYLQREGSITISGNYNKNVKRANDVLYFYTQYEKMLENIDITNETKKLLKEFISGAVIEKIKILKGDDLKEYYKKIKQYKILKNIRINSIRGFIKKMYYIYLIYESYYFKK